MISVVGKSNTGKTTLLEKLVAELKRRGYRVATVKHDTHGFDIDRPGKDSWRHARAGSDVVIISGPNRLAMIEKREKEITLNEIADRVTNVDIVLTEGYKRGDRPKIEVSRHEKGSELLCTEDELIAIAADQPFDMNVPQFGLDDAAGLVDLIEEKFLANPF
ncbi:MAG: molybdopterin-guanine dinucleotide biosynthesis protein B [Anaerolineales bacterium]|nr:MAG: molybdopterin-guanine dinucleotide biosynthesis protein B [Anaerolineales bacterium]